MMASVIGLLSISLQCHVFLGQEVCSQALTLHRHSAMFVRSGHSEPCPVGFRSHSVQSMAAAGGLNGKDGVLRRFYTLSRGPRMLSMDPQGRSGLQNKAAIE